MSNCPTWAGSSSVAVNAALAAEPELVNTDPYGAGWLVRLQPADTVSLTALLDPAAYVALLDTDH
jgi:glycine cleavage system H protein